MTANQPLKVTYLGAYPPRGNPAAIYTRQTVRQLAAAGQVLPTVYAVSDRPRPYGEDVSQQFRQDSRFAHMGIAEHINRSGAQLVMVAHDFDTYGGRHGEFVLDLVQRLEMPYMVTCHHLPASPQAEQREVLSDLCYHSAGVVVSGAIAAHRLQEVYEVAPEKVRTIPHGVPASPAESRAVLKAARGLGGRFVVSSFGHICPGKGLEFGIRATAEVARRHPDILYVIMGRTHPAIHSAQGEAYLSSLMALTAQLEMQDHVRFVDCAPSTDALVECLDMSDAYMTPYLSGEQQASHTLACAVGRGRVGVSTPYPFARELLEEGRGLLARYGDAQSLARCLTSLLESPGMQYQMEQNCRAAGEEMAWPRVASAHTEAMRHACRASHQRVAM